MYAAKGPVSAANCRQRNASGSGWPRGSSAALVRRQFEALRRLRAWGWTRRTWRYMGHEGWGSRELTAFIASETGFTVLAGARSSRSTRGAKVAFEFARRWGARSPRRLAALWCEAGEVDPRIEITDDRARMQNGDLIVEAYVNHEDRFVPVPAPGALSQGRTARSCSPRASLTSRRHRSGGTAARGATCSRVRSPSTLTLSERFCRARAAPARPAGPKGNGH